MSSLEIISIQAGVLAFAFIAIWLLSVRLSDVSIVDIAWGAGFVLVAWATLLVTANFRWQNFVLVGAVTIWGLRLSLHLAARNIGKGEDFRYQSMRKSIGKSFWWSSLLIVFGLQGVIMWTVSMPIQLAIGKQTFLPIVMILGASVWLVGLLFESVGDWQLSRFRADPDNRGRVLDTGLWRFTRHPNYFGDFLVWWGIYLLGVSLGAPWWTLFSPALMSFLLIRVSGVRLLEKTLTSSRPGYQEYVQRTNSFFPGLPRKLSTKSSA